MVVSLAAVLATGGAAALVPLGIALATAAKLGTVAAVAAALLGLAYFALACHFWRSRDDRRARLLLRASLLYLPAILVGLLLAQWCC